ncbi:MAG: hypothetical protein FJ290_25325 [Planctomycetes bacterium]|nr:hypothetical protein [Planctomycetota bacterium]
MAREKHAEVPAAKPFAATLIGWLGFGLSAAGAVACVVLAVVAILAIRRGKAYGDMLLYGLLFLPVSLLGLALFWDFLRLKDWVVAPEVPLGVKLLGHLGRILGTLAMAACVALCVLTIVCPGSVPPLPVGGASPPRASADAAAEAAKQVRVDVPRPLLAAMYILGIFISMLVRTVSSALSELRTWARPGALIVSGLAVALLTVALIFNLTRWRVAEARLALPLFLGVSVVMFLFLLVYLMLPPVVDAFERRRL